MTTCSSFSSRLMNMNAPPSLSLIFSWISWLFGTTLATKASLAWYLPKTSALTDILAFYAIFIFSCYFSGLSGSFTSSKYSSSSSESLLLPSWPPAFLPLSAASASSESSELSASAALDPCTSCLMDFFLMAVFLALSFLCSSRS